LQELLKIDPNIKVVVASGYTTKEKMKETLELGAAEFVGKPYRLSDMLNKVREVLDKE
jgi:DNA-binding NarL/FixJ family response regulator